MSSGVVTEADVMRVPLISTSDIAALANVRRQVVSMWKRRNADSEFPFPRPVMRKGQSDYFDCREVTAWFSNTGLGNNPDAASEVLTFADIDLLTDGNIKQTMIEALLLLRGLLREPLSPSADVLVSDADDHDTEHQFLFQEVQDFVKHPEHTDTVVSLINEVFDQSFSVSHSLGLLAKRARDRDLKTRGETISPALAEFSSQLLLALSEQNLINHSDPSQQAEPLRFIDLNSSHFDLVDHLLADEDYLASNPELLHNYPVVVQADQSAQERRTFRRLIAHNLNPQAINSFENLEPANTASFAFISPTAAEHQSLAILEAHLPDLAQSSPHHVGVIIGPQDLLVGSQQTEGVRSDLIRAGHIRCIVLLPEGLFPNHPREQLVLWILATPRDRPDPTARFYLADLTGVDFYANVQDLLTDCIAAVQDSRSRAYAFLQQSTIQGSVQTREIVFPLAKTHTSTTDPASDRILLEQTLLETQLHAGFPRVKLSGTMPHSSHEATLTLSAARTKRLVAMISGNRIYDDWVSYAPPLSLGTRVIDKDCLLRLAASSHATPAHISTQVIDPFTLGQLDQVRLTKPGDVVIVQHGGFRAAWCDREGGNVIAHPLRIIRPRSIQVHGPTVAADINAFQSHARDWKQWLVRIFPDRQAADATTVLREIEAERAWIVANLNALDTATQAIASAVSRGGVHVQLAE